MKLFIGKDSLAEDVKKVFTACYPFLKIEFYKRPLNNSQYKKEVIPLHLPLIQAKELCKTEINIEKDKTVAELEHDFSLIGLKAEVFRKSGNVWVETSLTNNWTLQQQNTEAEELSRHFDNI
ncbi:MAG: hypothetical protein ABJA35_13625 [Parafilimonas sp.]